MTIFYQSRRYSIGLSLILSINLIFSPRQTSSFHPLKYTFSKNTDRRFMTRISEKDEVIPRSIYERVLDNPNYPAEWPFQPDDFVRQDESDDSIFYDSPRLVYHIDDYAVSELTDYYKENLNDGDDVLDICSSWVSHYPADWKGGNVVGLGMNEYELSKNEQLTSYVNQDLNISPIFPFEDNSFDKVTCVVSIDYLTKPLDIIKEVGRVLRPGGTCMISISNRCFPTKAFRIWLLTNDLEHIFLVGSMFHYAKIFTNIKCDDRSPNPGRSDPLFIIRADKKND